MRSSIVIDYNKLLYLKKSIKSNEYYDNIVLSE